jgi:glycosyltransferase involved in cell wall biosynthesis
VAGDPWAYRDYVAASAAEFMVAKNLYVETRGGWVSDRSVCYLATGRPVVAQDTGLPEHYPRGEGLLLFSTVEEARAAVEEVRGNYARHARAAREVAEECFDSDKVLGRLLGTLGVA